jgi:hypothetical protein
MVSGWDFILVGLAALAAGAVNALAGGGTLITFPTLLALGIPPIAANVTNTVALCPGYLGATLAQWKDILGPRRRLWMFLAAAVIGGVAGGALLLHTKEQAFQALVPYLILLASALLALQEPVRAWVERRSGRSVAFPLSDAWAAVPVGLAAVYGGYFGGGLSVIVLSMLGLMVEDSLTQLNASKQIIAFAVNSAAAVFFLFSSRIVWPLAIVMALGATIGGVLGGHWAGRIPSGVLRWLVVAIGVMVAAIYFIR